MPTFKVTIVEDYQTFKEKLIEADSAEDARQIADGENWRDDSWEQTFQNGGTSIDTVEEVKQV